MSLKLILGGLLVMSVTDAPRDFDDLWDFSDPAATEEKFRALSHTESGAAPDYRAEILTQIARTLGLQQKFDEAHATLDEAEALLPQAGHVARVRVLLERGRCFNSAQEQERAAEFFQRAWKLANEHAYDAYAVDAAHMMEIASPKDQKLTWNLRAAEVAEGSENPRARKWLGSLYNNRGWTYHDTGQLAQAQEMFERTLAWLQETDGPARRIDVAWWCIAKMKRLRGDPAGALEIQKRLLATADDGYTNEELAECLLALGRGEEARPYFARAFELLSQDIWISRDEPERLSRLESLAGAESSSK